MSDMTDAIGRRYKGTADEAITVIARQLLVNHITDDSCANWENYSDLGENDWVRVQERAHQLANEPDIEEFQQAYWFLAERAEK